MKRAGLVAVVSSLALVGCTFSGSDGSGSDGPDAGIDEPTFDTGHRFRKSIEIAPQTEVEIGGFMLAIISDADPDLAAAARADGSDLLLTTADSTEALPIEIESYNPETGALALWVQRTLKDETLHLYYGHDGTVEREELRWPFDFRAVWHGQVAGEIAIDSSQNGLDATKEITGTLPTITDGAIGGGLDMRTTSASFDTKGDGIGFGKTSFTFSAWVHVTDSASTTDQPWHYGGNQSTEPGYDMELGTGPWRASVAGSGEVNTATFGDFDSFRNNWTHLVAVVDRDADRLIVYANGVRGLDALIADEADLTPSAQSLARIGGDESPFVGILDEVRVNASALSQVRIDAQYRNITDDSFVTFGPQQRPEN